jgi:hypothetical protein
LETRLGDRFWSRKTQFSGHKISIFDENSKLAGCVDVCGFNGAEFSIEGWVNARAITLHLGGQQATMKPEFPRADVSEAFGLPNNLGFFVKVSTTLQEMEGSDAPGITFGEVTGEAVIPPLSLPVSK